jgi:Flp pilus assembly protein TadG
MAPLVVLLLVVVAMAGRGVTARMDVDSVAEAAARAASLARSPTAALEAASVTAEANLGDGRITCVELDVDVNTDEFAPGGQVTVTVTCEVQLSDLAAGAGIPGSLPITSTASSGIDLYRGTDP